MNDFEEGKIGFTFTFSITIQNHKGAYFGFRAKEREHLTFKNSPVFKTKNEAIDAVIRGLSKMRDNDE